ncbi:hypothetical protein SDC9_212582 [bioreactor metagenome]|uniref:Uncharacterized protein n=1 Tax=bioreactor metagenome TaxID=1076179 RepID=A0A645JMC9_9ZZZZ
MPVGHTGRSIRKFDAVQNFDIIQRKIVFNFHRVLATRQHLGKALRQQVVKVSACFVKIDLNKHKIARQYKFFKCLQPAAVKGKQGRGTPRAAVHRDRGQKAL